MNILSLFDGMSCGQIALEYADIKIDNYLASEIDKPAIQITMNNYPNTIQLGDVVKIKSKNLPHIDLLIGGSPCQGFSFAGKQLNFGDIRSFLFFEFIILLNECKHKYFLLENVKMKQEYQDVISNYLNIRPVEINSGTTSAQDRKRLYWTNISFNPISYNNICLNDIVESNIDEQYYLSQNTQNRYKKNQHHKSIVNKSCVIGKLSKYQGDRIFNTKCKASYLSAYGGNNGGGSCNIIWDNKRIRKLTPTECEKLQNVPIHYTKGVTKNQRYKMLGNGWTVGVISHIFRGLR